MGATRSHLFLLPLLFLALASICLAARPVEDVAEMKSTELSGKVPGKPKHPFTSPVGLFIQERASKQLPGPGQHFSFGALVGWETILQMVNGNEDTKLVLLVRHGQALSNWLSDTLGPDEWFNVETKCSYTDKNGTTYGVFDADLTNMGQDEAKALNSMLLDGGWFSKLSGGLPARAIVSPLSRCLQTAQLVTQGLNITEFSVEENVRETLGEDTCDARRSASNYDSSAPAGPCEFQDGLRAKYPQFQFPVVGATPATRTANGGFGLISDEDILWTKDRETQKHQVKRATNFLYDLFTFAPEKVVVVVTHSGFTRSVLLAVGREPYRPQNTELVPVIVRKVTRDPQA